MVEVYKAVDTSSVSNVIVDRIKSVIDRVLWTAGATEWNKTLLAEAIAEEFGDVVKEERDACIRTAEIAISLCSDPVVEMQKRSKSTL